MTQLVKGVAAVRTSKLAYIPFGGANKGTFQCQDRVAVLKACLEGTHLSTRESVEFCKGARQSGLVSVWQHTLVGQRLQGFLGRV